jgi:hypothetical protein
MKRKALAIILILLFPATSVSVLVKEGKANPYPYTNCDSSFVTVSVVSPENKTYDSNSILLNITAGAYPGIFFVGYCLDGGPFVQVAPEKWDTHIFGESVWLNELSKGSHYVIVEAGAPETSNNVVTDSTQVYFTVTKDLVPEPTSSTPPPTPPRGEQVLVFDNFLVWGIAGAVAVAVLILLIYLIKRK